MIADDDKGIFVVEHMLKDIQGLVADDPARTNGTVQALEASLEGFQKSKKAAIQADLNKAVEHRERALASFEEAIKLILADENPPE